MSSELSSMALGALLAFMMVGAYHVLMRGYAHVYVIRGGQILCENARLFQVEQDSDNDNDDDEDEDEDENENNTNDENDDTEVVDAKNK